VRIQEILSEIIRDDEFTEVSTLHNII